VPITRLNKEPATALTVRRARSTKDHTSCPPLDVGSEPIGQKVEQIDPQGNIAFLKASYIVLNLLGQLPVHQAVRG